MIKLIIFDLDGVLVDARQLHYESMNAALASINKDWVISIEEHLSTYDGLPTRKKLKMLSKNKGVPEDLHHAIWELKQKKTMDIINGYAPDDRMAGILRTFKSEGYQIACATNSIRDTAKLQLIRRGFIEYIDYLYTNQDVINSKPHSEIYLRCMIRALANPKQTLIVEDSHIGRKAAAGSGAHVCAVENSSDVTLHKIKLSIQNANEQEQIRPKWQGGKMNVLIPMAGAGAKFEKAGYSFPKPLVDVNGKPMMQLIVENLNIDARHIFIVRKKHYEKYNLKYLLSLITNDNCEIVQVDSLTEGAACTTLLAEEYINNNDALIIANSDQYIEWESNEFMWSMAGDDIDGGIATFTSTHPKWSFVRLDEHGFVSEVAEKKAISDIATVGVYYWRKGSDYVRYAHQMIEKDIRTNNEFYVCPVFNEAIADGKKIKIYNVAKMWGLGTPEDLEHYISDFHSS